ncbi:MAG TPA: hypothetical protein PKW35_03450 [Nannocystaceae bacterium]|nr:hypothetical protein [Nannocystaceae bacterium]
MSKPLTIALTLACLAVTALLTPLPLALRDFDPSDTARTLTVLFVISLVLERALEVFVSTWRTPDMRTISMATKRARRRLHEAREAGEVAEIRAATESLRAREKAEQEYRSATHVFALRLGFLFGIAVSMVGIRTFEGLLAPGAIAATSPFQSVAFRAVDVLMTGGVIAGGSDAIHKIILLFTSFMDATTLKVKAGAGRGVEEVTAEHPDERAPGGGGGSSGE